MQIPKDVDLLSSAVLVLENDVEDFVYFMETLLSV